MKTVKMNGVTITKKQMETLAGLMMPTPPRGAYAVVVENRRAGVRVITVPGHRVLMQMTRAELLMSAKLKGISL
jgi:hypothetical protein